MTILNDFLAVNPASDSPRICLGTTRTKEQCGVIVVIDKDKKGTEEHKKGTAAWRNLRGWAEGDREFIILDDELQLLVGLFLCARHSRSNAQVEYLVARLKKDVLQRQQGSTILPAPPVQPAALASSPTTPRLPATPRISASRSPAASTSTRPRAPATPAVPAVPTASTPSTPRIFAAGTPTRSRAPAASEFPALSVALRVPRTSIAPVKTAREMNRPAGREDVPAATGQGSFGSSSISGTQQGSSRHYTGVSVGVRTDTGETRLAHQLSLTEQLQRFQFQRPQHQPPQPQPQPLQIFQPLPARILPLREPVRNPPPVSAFAHHGDVPKPLPIPPPSNTKTVTRKRVDARDECPICFEELKASRRKMVWCQGQCGTNFHKVCLDKWFKANDCSLRLCPTCRGRWEDDGPSLIGNAMPTTGLYFGYNS